MPPSCRICTACFSSRICGFAGWTSKYCDMPALSAVPTAARSGRSLDALLERGPDRRQMGRQRGQGAQVHVAFGGAVEVAAARGEQPELERGLGVAQRIGRAVAAGHDLDAAPAVGLELGEERVLLVGAELVARRVRDHRQAAGAGDPAHCIAQGGPAVWHETGLALDQVLRNTSWVSAQTLVSTRKRAKCVREISSGLPTYC